MGASVGNISDYAGSQKFNQAKNFGRIGSTHGMIMDANQDFMSDEEGISDV